MTNSVSVTRVSARRRATIEEALDHAEQILGQEGAGVVSVAEIARRMGIRPPSLYKYFPSLHAIYDALFARGNARLSVYVDEALDGQTPGLDRLLEQCRAMSRWSMLNQGLAPLLFWRPIPGFQPSPASFELATELVARARDDVRVAVRKRQLVRSADSVDTLRLLTAITAGICSQQLANQPGVSYEDGLFTSLTDRALEMFVHAHAPRPRKAQQ
jgi:AcrR family transcriptional regulator